MFMYGSCCMIREVPAGERVMVSFPNAEKSEQ
jgi:hypothetical protein